MTKTIAATITPILALLWAGLFTVDVAAAGKARVGVVSLRGAGEGQVRAKISAALKANGFQVVGTEQLESSASGLGVSLDSDAGLRAVAKELNISAFVAGELSKKKAALTVKNGADGAVLGDDSFAGPNPKKIAALVGSTFWRQLGPAVRQGKPPAGAKTKAVIAEEAAPPEEAAEEAAPPPPAEEKPPERKKKASKKAAEPPPEAEAAESEAPKPKAKAAPAAESAEEETAAGGPVLPALTVGVGGRALFRQLAYHQNVSGLPPYSLSPGPEIGFWLEAYPAAFATQGFAANIGVFGEFNQGVGVTSTTMSTPPLSLTTKFQDFLGGVKVRWPVNIFAPYLSVAYGAQTFKFEAQNGVSPVPSVAYKFIRLGLGTRADFGAHASADLGLGYLVVTDTGSEAGAIKSATYFPGTTAAGIDVAASAAYRFTKLLGARVGVDFRQYGLDFHATPSSVPLAGGAADRYITVWGGIELTLDGMGGGASADDDESEPAPAPKGKKVHKEEATPAEE